MRKILILLIIPSLLLLVRPVFAQTPTATRGANRAALKAQNQEDKVSDLKSRADREIDRRIASLNDAVSKVSGMKKLSDSQKTQYKTSLENEISSLQSLKTKIDADTDLATLKTDVASIVKDYRVYLVYLPQTRILATVDRINTTSDLLTTQSSSLSARIQNAKTSGHDTSSLESLLSDMNAKISDAKTQAQNAANLVSTLTPQGYPGNKGSLDQARADIKAAIADLVAAHKDALQIKQGLRSFSPTPTP